MEIKTKKMLPQLLLRADLGSVNEQNRTVEVVWSTGSKGLRSSYFDDPYYEELSMLPEHVNMERLNAGTAPVLAVHNTFSLDDVIGVVERAWLEKGQGKALLRFSEADESADRAFKKIKEGILRNVSVGYSVQEYTDVSEPNAKIRTFRATRWEPKEISIVPIGFDMKATTRNNEIQNEVEILESRSNPVEDPVMDKPVTEVAVETKPAVEAEVAPAAVAEQPQADLTRVAEEATAKERTRVSEIVTAVRAAKLDESFAQQLIVGGTSVADASKEIFKKLKEQSAETAVRSPMSAEITRDEKVTRQEGLENFLLHRVNSKIAITENGRRFYGMSLVRMCEELLGGRPLGTTDIQLANRAMATSDLPNILANVAEKSMREEFKKQEPSFQKWCKQGKLRNYKTANRLMLGDFPTLEVVSENGEAKMGSVAESKETIALQRYMKAIAFTKEMIVNDDLNALSDFSVKAARAASRLESSLVYTSVLQSNSGAGPTMGDSIALFHTSHANKAASGGAISVTTIGAGWAAMRKQTTLDGLEYADLTPEFLLVGPDSEAVARQFVSQNLLASAASSVNPFAGRLEVIVDPRITGNHWYLAAGPSQIDTIEVARLEGEDGPIVTVEKGKTPGSSLITCEHSVGAAAIDFRGLYYNAGA